MTESPPAVDPDAVLSLIRRHQSTGRALLYSLAGPLDVETSAAGPWVTGALGRRYLDLGSYAVFLLGHSPAPVVAAVAEQLARLPGSSRAFPSQVNAEAAAALARLAPEGLSKVMLLNSGAEAVEAAIKLARATTGRPGLLHLAGSFHGKTMGALSLTDDRRLRSSFTPLLPEVRRISRADAAAAVEAIVSARPAAVFVEPVQGEGGVFEVGGDYLRAVRAACDESGALLVCDEIQCGRGRCGDLWVSRAAGVQPDILLTGKALGGGVMPASALVATPGVFEPFDRDPLLHTSTFGGNPLASAAVLATLRFIDSERVPRRAAELGRLWRVALEDLRTRWPRLFVRVSGRGLLLGLHCRAPEGAGTFLRACLAGGILVTPCLTVPHVVRLTPSVCLDEALIEEAAAGLEGAASAAMADLGLVG
jgi:putrescine aminotransferase